MYRQVLLISPNVPSSNGIYSILNRPFILIWAGTAVGLAGQIGIGNRILNRPLILIWAQQLGLQARKNNNHLSSLPIQLRMNINFTLPDHFLPSGIIEICMIETQHTDFDQIQQSPPYPIGLIVEGRILGLYHKLRFFRLIHLSLGTLSVSFDFIFGLGTGSSLTNLRPRLSPSQLAKRLLRLSLSCPMLKTRGLQGKLFQRYEQGTRAMVEQKVDINRKLTYNSSKKEARD